MPKQEYINNGERVTRPMHGRVAVLSENGASQNGDVRIQLMTERVAKQGVLAKDVYLEVGNILRCYGGSIRFELENRDPIVIAEGESIVVYPCQRLTVVALDKVNRFAYVNFEGPGVESYFNRFGFFNGVHGRTTTQIEVFREVKRRLDDVSTVNHSELLTRLSIALITYVHDLRIGYNGLVFDAVRQIRENLKNRIVRLGPLYEQLQVGHTALSLAFMQAGMSGPGGFVRMEQLRLVKHLLCNTQKPISEIADEAGFISVTHFANFIKRNTGMTAREIRRTGRKGLNSEKR